MENTNDSITLLRNIVDRQKAIIETQNSRMHGYLSIIDYISTLARSKDVTIPFEKVTALVEAKTDKERDDLLIHFKMQIVQDVLDDYEKEAEAFEKSNGGGWDSPEWDDGVFAPPTEEREIDTDITKWKTFNRKWRMFGDE